MEEEKSVQQAALDEFDAAVETLKSNNVRVTVFQDTVYHVKPDAIFPNNWISVHSTGEIVFYPMATPNRRLERRMDLMSWLESNFKTNKKINLTKYEDEDKFLEGTGSIVFDYESIKNYY